MKHINIIKLFLFWRTFLLIKVFSREKILLTLQMEFEDILKDVGDFGRYQILLVTVFLAPTYNFVPWISLNAIFVASTPEHWCKVPELESSNLTVDEKKYLIRPASDPFCLRYDVNYSKILESGNLTVDPMWPVKECDHGWSYDTSDYDETAVTKWNLVCENDYYESLIVSFVFFGVIIGTPIYGYFCDRCGRKPTFLGLALLIGIAEISSAFCPFLTLFLILRIVIGSTMSTMYCLGYIIVLELVRPDLRARINGIATNCWTMGMCLLSLVAYLTRSWVYLSIVMASVDACLLLFYWILPESPSWLISQEKYEEAATIMHKISRVNKRDISYDQLLKSIQTLGKLKKENQHKNSPMDFLRYPTMRFQFLLCIVVWIGVSIPYYGLQANVNNLSGNEFFNFFLLAIAELPAHFITWWLLNNKGRKKSVQFGYIVCTIACLVPAFKLEIAQLDIVVALVAKAGASAAFMAQYQLSPEIFPTSLRGVGMGLTSTIGVGTTLLAPFIIRLSDYASYLTYLVFAIICSISCICVSFLPETLNKNLPQTVEDVEKSGKDNNACSCRVSG